MHTHLLHAVPAITPDANCDNGVAANDDRYRLETAVPLLTIALPCAAVERSNTDVANHDYYLDGYAGI